jgi:surface antigen
VYGVYGVGAPDPRNNDDAGRRWQQQYQRQYTYQDDSYYRDCRSHADPGGVIAGALIGGLLGNAIGRGGGRGGATIAGVVLGGGLGAALTRNMDCGDRSYAYNTYYNGFNAGRTDVPYQWRNPSNGHYGEFRVNDYSNDQGGFRCANFTQQIFINGRPQAASGRACQQPDGTWAVVG